MLRLKLIDIMDKRGINTRQLSEMTGIRWNTVDDMAKNKAKHWNPENLEKIMIALGVSEITDVIEYIPDKKEPSE